MCLQKHFTCRSTVSTVDTSTPARKQVSPLSYGHSFPRLKLVDCSPRELLFRIPLGLEPRPDTSSCFHC